jgi:hypothetical protein
MEERHLVLALDLPAALAAAARLERMRAAWPDDARERKAMSGLAIAYHHFKEPVDIEAYTRLTPRAVILLPGVSTTGARTIMTGTAWCAREVGVRVAELWERDRVEDVLEAREFFAWQFETWYADHEDGTAPSSLGAEAGWRANVGPALALMHDPGLQAVASYRSREAAGIVDMPASTTRTTRTARVSPASLAPAAVMQ